MPQQWENTGTTPMTAKECLGSSDAKAVTEYYTALRRRGEPGERAFQLLRAHRNCARMFSYDDPKYLKFLANRRDYALQELLDFIGAEKGLADVERIVVMIDLGTQIRFESSNIGTWHTAPGDEAVILDYCDRVMQLKEREGVWEN